MHPEDDNALNTEERIWDLTMQINLKGVWWGCKYAILAMRKNPEDPSRGLRTGGSIINTASFVALMGAATPQLACESLHLCRISIFIDSLSRYRFQGNDFIADEMTWTEKRSVGCSSCNDTRARYGSRPRGNPNKFYLPVCLYELITA